jgi:hypothetical protein
MRLCPHSVPGCTLMLALFALSGVSRPVPPKDTNKIPSVRWDETHPGCTFSRGEDGKYRYGLWAGDVGITLAVDAQEVEKVRRRHEPFFSVWLSVHYRGKDTLDVRPQKTSLEFTTHFKVTQPALDPDSFSAQVQEDADELDYQTAREIEKHPELKASKEELLRAFQKDSVELIEFLSKNSLRPAHLDSGNPEISGWILFSTKNKWIGGWKKQEEFILRFPIDRKILEFPFKLPEKQGELILRHRN